MQLDSKELTRKRVTTFMLCGVSGFAERSARLEGKKVKTLKE